jgi:hypothetical protein
VAENLFGQRLPCLTVSRSIQVAVIEGERVGIRPRSAARPQIEQGQPMRARPGFTVLDAGSINVPARGPFHQIRIERKVAHRNVAIPCLGQGLHAIEGIGALHIGHPLHPFVTVGNRLAIIFSGHQLCFVGQRKNDAPQAFIQGDMPHQKPPPCSREARGAVHPLNIRDEGEVEVVHGDEHDGPVGLILRDGMLEQPRHHACGVSGLSGIEEFDVGMSFAGKSHLRKGADALVILNSPAKYGGVTHDGDPCGARRARGTETGSQSLCIGADLELVGLSHAHHGVADHIGHGAPAARSIRIISGLKSRQSCTHFRQTEHRGSHGQSHQQSHQFGQRASGHVRDCIRRLWLMAFLWMCATPALAVTVTVQVAVPTGELQSTEDGTITADLRWLGRDHSIPLSLGSDGVWSGTQEGPQVRALGVSLWRKDGVRPIRVSQGLEIMPVGDATLSWSLAGPQTVEAWRLSRAVLSDDLKRAEERRAMMATGWLFLTVLLVLWLGRRALGKQEAPPILRPLRMWHEAVGWLLFAALWTWPAVTAGPNIVGRHFDALGTVWVIDAATRLGLTLHDTMTVWPAGVTYSAIDSWVLLPLSWLGSMLSAPTVHGWIQVLGVALTGFAASRFARVVGAHSPFDLVAGLFFMGSGLTAAALLEGHVYQVFNPWMPLMGMYLWLASRPDAHWKHGVWAGVFFALSLFTSGYIGLAAGLVGLGLGIPVVLRTTRRGPILLAGVIAVCAGLVYMALFAAASQPGAANASAEALRKGSLALTSIGPPTTEVDRAGHSWALVISSSMVALALLAWRMRTDGAKKLWGIAGITVLIALGPEWALGLSPDEPMLTSPFSALWEIPAVQFLRWPGRLMWAALLVLSVLAAVGVSRLALRLGPKIGVGLMLLVLVEVFFVVGLPFRQRTLSGEVPSVYNESSGPVYDLVGQGINQSAEIDSWINATLCQYQTVHGRSIAKDCMRCRTGSSADLAEDCAPEDSERAGLNAWITARLYEGNVEAVMARLQGLNFTSMAVHPDWIRKSDRMRLQHALSQRTPAVETEVADGVLLYSVDPEDQEMVLTDGPPLRLVGPESDPLNWFLRVDLVLPPGMTRGRFFFVVGQQSPIELRYRGGVIANLNGGGIYAGHFNGPVDAEVPVRLYRVQDGKTSTLWSGPVVPLDLTEDLITFRLDSEKTATPMLRSLDAFSPEIRHRGGKIIGLGWAGILLLCLMWWLGVRRFGS